MRQTRRAVLGAAAAMTTGLAGCTGGTDGDDGSGDAGDGADTTPTASPTGEPTPTASPTETASPTPAADATVRIRTHPDLGEILVGPDGRTLYMFDSDTEGEGASTCHGGCAEAWPPLNAEDDPTAGGAVTAELGTFEREGGGTQVAADGWPLYYFASDEMPGDVSGQGVNDVWWVLGPDGTPKRADSTPTATPQPGATVRVRTHPDLGEILVGPDGNSLYMFDRDTRGSGSSACRGDCASAWPPLTVEGDPTAGGAVTAELGTFEREGGGTQVAAGGWPLYYFADDGAPGAANGQGAGDVWWVLGPGGGPKRPASTPSSSPTPTPDGGNGGSDPY
jgi:predicted lipoprotein with Yx(FWY)xxD motif